MKAERTPLIELEKLISDDHSRNFLTDLMKALPNIVAVLNNEFRLIYSNQELLDKADLKSLEDAFMLRPGELFKCVNSDIHDKGCGHSAACQLCGALSAMKHSKSSDERVTETCRILSKKEGTSRAYNFRFTSTPFDTGDERFYIVNIEDISSRTRKEELEHIFFHDLMNAVGGLSGLIDLLKNDEKNKDHYLNLLDEVYHNLYNTIHEQKQLVAAENKDLSVHEERVLPSEVIKTAATPFVEHNNYKAAIEILPFDSEIMVHSDPTLLVRILTNMLKNALEASGPSDTVRVGAECIKGRVKFFVSNPAVMPPDVKYQVFERSFSTKGTGRGLGTYSMKLLGENYLKGNVDFLSEEGVGTTFWIDLPGEKAG